MEYSHPSAFNLGFLTGILISAFIYGSFPLFFSKFRKAPISLKKYTWLTVLFVFVIWVLFFIASYLLTGGTITSSGAPAVLWGTIFYFIGKKELQKKGLLIINRKQNNEQQKTSTTITEAINQGIESNNLQKQICFCRICGASLQKDAAFCSMCGTKVLLPTDKKC